MTRFVVAIREKIQGKPFSVRSSKWQTVRKNFLESNKTCAACGADINLSCMCQFIRLTKDQSDELTLVL